MVRTTQNEKDTYIGARVPYSLKKLMKKFISMDTHLNESDFIRDAVREKIQKEAPELYQQLFQEVSR